MKWSAVCCNGLLNVRAGPGPFLYLVDDFRVEFLIDRTSLMPRAGPKLTPNRLMSEKKPGMMEISGIQDANIRSAAVDGSQESQFANNKQLRTRAALWRRAIPRSR